MANHLKKHKQQTIAMMLVEGCSIRAIERMTRVHRDTILRLLVRMGDHCEQIMDREVRELITSSVQCDELWTFVGKKERQLMPGDPAEYGDTYGYLAIERESKLVLAVEMGKRDEPTTDKFIETLSGRVTGNVQIFTDGWASYPPAIRRHFGDRAHYMQIIKHFAGENTDNDHRYSPPRASGIDHVWKQGFPQSELVSTSHIERHNWTTRTALRRFTRLSNGFSRKLENLRAALNVYVVWYNWVKRHTTLRMTPAEAAGISSMAWPIDALIPN